MYLKRSDTKRISIFQLVRSQGKPSEIDQQYTEQCII